MPRSPPVMHHRNALHHDDDDDHQQASPQPRMASRFNNGGMESPSEQVQLDKFFRGSGAQPTWIVEFEKAQQYGDPDEDTVIQVKLLMYRLTHALYQRG